MKHALAGLRVLDFCWVGAGALVTKLLAEHGAEVIKVESRARPDNLRVAPPYRAGAEGLDGSGYFASRNNDKKSFSLNMQHERSRELARRLAAGSDLVTNNFRPGVMERWGLGYEQVAELNPSVIYLSMPMQGAEGPHSRYVGFGSTIAALSGLVRPLRPARPRRRSAPAPTIPTTSRAPGTRSSPCSPRCAQRNRTGQGRLIELSQLEATVNMIAPAIAAAAAGEQLERDGNRIAAHCPSGVFRCARRRRMVRDLGAQRRRVVGPRRRPRRARPRPRPALCHPRGRKANEDALEAALAPLVRLRDRHKLAAELQAAGIPALAVLSSGDLLEDEQLRARGFWRTLEHPVHGRDHGAGRAVHRRRRARTGPVRAAPLLGEHTREVARRCSGSATRRSTSSWREKVLW